MTLMESILKFWVRLDKQIQIFVFEKLKNKYFESYCVILSMAVIIKRPWKKTLINLKIIISSDEKYTKVQVKTEKKTMIIFIPTIMIIDY